MHPGSPTTSAPGATDDLLVTPPVTVLEGPDLRTRFNPRSGYGRYWKHWVDGDGRGPSLYADNAASLPWPELVSAFAPDQLLHSVSLLDVGDWGGNELGWDLGFLQDYFEDGIVDRIKATMEPTLDLFSHSDGSQLTNWTAAGLVRFRNCAPHPNRPQWGVLDLSLTDSGGTRTVTLSLDGVTVATGSIVGDGTCTLAENNGSGASFTVDVAYTTDKTSAQLVARWPASYPVHHQITDAFIGGDFPRDPEGRIYDDGYANAFRYVSDRQTAGTHYVIPRQTDDAGNESANTDGGGTTVALNTPPEPPGFPAILTPVVDVAQPYVQWEASATAGATYNIYDSTDTGFLDATGTPTYTHVSGSGTLSEQLDAVPAFTGTRYLLVRAVNGGVEEKNGQILFVEFDSGNVVLPRPNAPQLRQVSISGREITVTYTIDANEQDVAPATVEIFLFDPEGSPSYASADASAAVPTAIGGVYTGTIAVTAGGDVIKKVAIRSVSAGSVQSNNTDTHGPYKLTTTAPSGPSASTIEAGY